MSLDRSKLGIKYQNHEKTCIVLFVHPNANAVLGAECGIKGMLHE
jgi:hypothetical protein